MNEPSERDREMVESYLGRFLQLIGIVPKHGLAYFTHSANAALLPG
jgi:hypothetical protein